MSGAPFTTGMAGPAAVSSLNDLWNRVAGTGTLVDGVAISCDISQVVRVFDVTLGGNRTINFTGGSVDTDGKQIFLRVKQDGTGSRTLTMGTGARFGADLTSFSCNPTAGKTDYIGVVYNFAADKYDIVAYARGY